MVSIFPTNAKRIDGELEIGGCRVSDIAARYGTPIFILDESDLKVRIGNWNSEFKVAFAQNSGQIYYAAKSFISVEVAKLINEAGIGVDVCTGGELAVVRAAKFPGERIEMHGNNKSEPEIAAAIDYRVGVIVLDSLQEIERVARIAHEKNRVQGVMLRLNPGVEAHTHEYIATAHEDVKFGFSISSGAAWDALLAVVKHESLQLLGAHCHIGSQIFAVDAFKASALRLIEFLARYKSEFGNELESLNIGGGVGIAYTESDKPMNAKEFLANVKEAINSESARAGIITPKISIEPGRALIGPSMVTLYTVGTTKEVQLKDGATRLYVSVDGGMSDNIRTSLYGAVYSAEIANRESNAKLRDCRIVGKHCETGDIVINSINLPSDIAPGDLIAVPATGAYGRSMASNYNHVPRPGVISVVNGTARTIIRSETEADLLALDVVEAPQRLSKESN
ncbi:MAG: diaminopimelate decarboxylase [Actinobacteria bacterium]|nr:diaminopimelate decarboxylase [Actinomycetota bacterium]